MTNMYALIGCKEAICIRTLGLTRKLFTCNSNLQWRVIEVGIQMKILSFLCTAPMSTCMSTAEVQPSSCRNVHSAHFTYPSYISLRDIEEG